MGSRRRAFEAGASDPWGDEFVGPDVELFSIGGGDEIEPLFDTGGGEPWLLAVDVDISVGASDIIVSIASELYSPSRYEDLDHYSQEGGWVLELTALGMVFLDGVYRIDLVNVSTLQTYPTLKPGCNSARFGQRSSCRPIKNGTALHFATSAAPTGEYEIHLTFPDDTTTIVSGTIFLTHVPDSPHFKSLLRLPYRVYSPKNPIQGF